MPFYQVLRLKPKLKYLVHRPPPGRRGLTWLLPKSAFTAFAQATAVVLSNSYKENVAKPTACCGIALQVARERTSKVR